MTTPSPGATGTPRLACKGVTVRFGGLVAVNNVDLVVPPAAIVGLVGPNGAGKSTLFGVLSGLIRPSHGTVSMDGQDVTHTRAQNRAARGLARTFQHPEIFTGMSVRDHLVIAHRAKHAKSRILSDVFTMGGMHPVGAAERDAIEDIIDLVGLRDIADMSAMGLPLGVARLVELGRALAASPTVLLLDEPSSGLDSSETAEFERVLRRVTDERGISILLVEHDVELVMRLCSSISVLDFGALIANGAPAEIRANPAVRAAYLGEEVETPDAPEQTAEDVELAVVRDAASSLAASSEGPEGADQGDLLTVKDLSVRYGEATALSGVSFSLKAGQVLAVLGANGAGKSSLARAVSGLVPPAGGSITFDGRNIQSRSCYKIRRAGMVHLPEGRGVFRGLSVTDNLRMAAGTQGGRRARRESVDLALEIFPALAARRHQRAGLLSGGEQQMLSLARALATSPKLIIADEMSLGLAPKMVDLVFDGLARARDAGVTVIMIEQYVHRALGFADECLVLQRGSVAWQGPAGSARGEVLRHYLGDAMTVAS
jgi:ABC-type branched-subunit amino acid transport system ATPase component